MSDNPTITGTVAGIKPRGQAKGFWTLELDVEGKQYPVKVSFNQFRKDSEESTGFYEFLNEAMAERRAVVATYYETEGSYNGQPVTYKNGTDFTYAEEREPGDWGRPEPQSGAGADTREDSGADAQQPSQPAPVASKEDYWARREASEHDRQGQIQAAWAIGQAIALGQTDPSRIEEIAHELIILKNKIAKEWQA